jgi:hypothetical protein
VNRRLARRIANTQNVQAQAMSGMHPAGTAATPMVMPMSQVTYAPVQGYPWGAAAYQDLNPVYSPDGALIAAYDSTTSWGGVHPAGRASPAHA